MFRNSCCNSRQNFGMQDQFMMQQAYMEGQVIEPTITKCAVQEFYHEVPHICPIHTHTINKHIYKHTYTPQYTCSEECQTVNLDCGKCSGFIN